MRKRPENKRGGEEHTPILHLILEKPHWVKGISYARSRARGPFTMDLRVGPSWPLTEKVMLGKLGLPT